MKNIDKMLEVENFFANPEEIRNAALGCEFWRSEAHPEGGNWPGLRSDYVSVISEDLFDSFTINLYKALGWDSERPVHFETFYQLCVERDMDCWVHQDVMEQKWTHVGLVYLTPDPPPNSGTLIYKPKDNKSIEDLKRESHNVDVPGEKEHYEVTHELINVYNKCVVYNPEALHSADKYFGDSMSSGRLSQVFFARDETISLG